MATRTRLVLLMHPKEFKQEKAATGRLTHLCLANSEIVVGANFDTSSRVGELQSDPRNLCVLLYPGKDAVNLSESPSSAPSDGVEQFQRDVHDRQLVVFILDATWALARKMLKLSPVLQALPRVMFTPSAPSRYLIKQQPAPGCLSTLEAAHELLTALERARLDEYPDRAQLLELFARMQQFQIDCARDPARAGYRRSEYRPPGERKPVQGRSGKRRLKMFRAVAVHTAQQPSPIDVPVLGDGHRSTTCVQPVTR